MTPFPTCRHSTGRAYAAAVAWHRKSIGSEGWSNLDLRVLDGASVLAASSTPDDLYECVRFVAPSTGTLTLEVTGSALEGGDQPFAWAVADTPTPPPIAGLFAAFSEGCPGSTGAAGTLCGGINTLAVPDRVA